MPRKTHFSQSSADHHHQHVDADATTQATTDPTTTLTTQPTSLFSPVQATTSTDPSTVLLSLLSQQGMSATE